MRNFAYGYALETSTFVGAPDVQDLRAWFNEQVVDCGDRSDAPEDMAVCESLHARTRPSHSRTVLTPVS